MKIARSRPSLLALLVVPVVAACTALASGDRGKDAVAQLTPSVAAKTETVHTRTYSDRYDARPRGIAR